MAPPKKQLSIEEYRLHEKSFIAEEEEGEENNDQKKQKVEDIPRISYHPKFTEQLPTPPTELTPLEQLTQNLYVYHITREIELLGYDIPDCVGELIESNYTDLIFKLADDFKSSPQRLWVSQQARAVDLNTLNFKNFADLLTSLFQEGGVTAERVLVLFFFCTDLSVRALKHHMRGAFYEMYKWTLRFLRTRLSNWIGDVGGWDVIFQQGPRDDSLTVAMKVAVLTLCTLGIVSLSIYIKKSVEI